jgi:glycosyltransferase involved in cell wall biosynthesis
VEAVMLAQTEAFIQDGYPVTIIAGRGDPNALPRHVQLIRVPEMDSQYPAMQQLSNALVQGQVPDDFELLTARLEAELGPILDRFDNVIIHNILTKHFNLPLTAALFRLLERGRLHNCIAWCHDLSWTSAHSRDQLHPGYPWDLLRRYDPKITYVVISRQRQEELAGLLGCPIEQIRVIYNGVEPETLLGLSEAGKSLARKLGLFTSPLNVLMPVRVTQAKNIELALQVVAEMKALNCQLRLVITGPPDPHDEQSMQYYQSLLDLRHELGLEEEVCFVFENGQLAFTPLTIAPTLVGELFRMADLVFMPSHREGFGLPVLEAGLTGLPVFSTPIPAAREIGGMDVHLFAPDEDPGEIARMVLDWAETDPVHHLKARVRMEYTWSSIFTQQIKPMIKDGISG